MASRPETRTPAAKPGESARPAAGIAEAGADGRAGLGLRRGELALALVGVFLTSLAFLAFQIAASRLLSLLLSYHFVFAVVSLSMLGLGIGGVIARFAFSSRLSPRDALGVLAGANAVAALAILGGVALVLWVAQRPLVSEPTGVLVVLAILFVPLACAGVAFAQLFRSFGTISGRVYGADLAGAAIGCLGVIWALDQLGGIGSLLFAAALAAVGAVAFAWPARAGNGSFGATATVFAVLALVFAAFVTGRYDPQVPVGTNPDKEIHDAIAGPARGQIEASRWSSFGRTDLVTFAERRGFKDIYIDGTAGSPMYAFTGDFTAPGEAVEQLIDTFPGYFPFLFMPEENRERALVIGPGGGRDILLARMAGFGHVRAVEVNPDLVDLVREQRAYNGDIFGAREDIQIIIDEGRSFVRREDDRYDLVMLSLPVTNTSRSREGFALTESFLLTAEAISDYLDVLSDQGELVVVTHDEAAILRMATTVIAAMANRGLAPEQAMERIYVLGSFPYPVFVLRQVPISEDDSHGMLAEAQARGYSLASTFFPGVGAPGVVSPVLQAIEQGQMSPDEIIRLAAEREVDITPVRDDSPFFHHFELSPPAAVRIVAAVAAGLTLVILLGAVISGHGGGGGSRVLYPGLFLFIGIGFMLIEVSLIQRFMLFLGQPVHVLAVVLFALLMGMSLGSVASSRIRLDHSGKALAGAGATASLVLALVILFLPPLFDAALGLPLAARFVIAGAVLLPLGVLLGLPFPLGIRALAQAGETDRIPWMWALNGSASVVGASAAILLAMEYGLSLALVAAALCYLLVALTGLIFWKLGPSKAAG